MSYNILCQARVPFFPPHSQLYIVVIQYVTTNYHGIMTQLLWCQKHSSLRSALWSEESLLRHGTGRESERQWD